MARCLCINATSIADEANERLILTVGQRQNSALMAIPDIDNKGLLPLGVYDCSLDEIGARFGGFQQTDRRPRLFEKLKAYVREVRGSGVVVAIIVDGSFVTAEDNPGDIDLVLVLPGNHDVTADLSPMQYNVLSHRRVKARYEFDVFVARQDSKEYH